VWTPKIAKSKNDKEAKFETMFFPNFDVNGNIYFPSGHMSTATDIMSKINCLLPRAAKMM